MNHLNIKLLNFTIAIESDGREHKIFNRYIDRAQDSGSTMASVVANDNGIEVTVRGFKIPIVLRSGESMILKLRDVI